MGVLNIEEIASIVHVFFWFITALKSSCFLDKCPLHLISILNVKGWVDFLSQNPLTLLCYECLWLSSLRTSFLVGAFWKGRGAGVWLFFLQASLIYNGTNREDFFKKFETQIIKLLLLCNPEGFPAHQGSIRCAEPVAAGLESERRREPWREEGRGGGWTELWEEPARFLLFKKSVKVSLGCLLCRCKIVNSYISLCYVFLHSIITWNSLSALFSDQIFVSSLYFWITFKTTQKLLFWT